MYESLNVTFQKENAVMPQRFSTGIYLKPNQTELNRSNVRSSDISPNIYPPGGTYHLYD